MCGRYVLNAPEDLSERFQLHDLTLQLPLTFNAAPSQRMPVILMNEAGDRELKLMQWGLVPGWARRSDKKLQAPINARAETLSDKPMFRNLMKGHRCLVPANGFYEWKAVEGGKQPYLITLPDEPTLAFAGLYDEYEENGETRGSYTIVTTAANGLMASIHDRMPVILPREDEDEWLDREITESRQVERLLRPYPAEQMRVVAVSKSVNNTRNDGPKLIEPIGD